MNLELIANMKKNGNYIQDFTFPASLEHLELLQALGLYVSCVGEPELCRGCPF